MSVKDVMDKVLGKEEPKEELDDDVTRDKYLRSLRRERRIQMEEEEKKRLINEIRAHRQHKLRTEGFGVKDDAKMRERDALFKKIKSRQQGKVLANQRPLLKENSMLNNRKNEFKKKNTTKGNILSTNMGF